MLVRLSAFSPVFVALLMALAALTAARAQAGEALALFLDPANAPSAQIVTSMEAEVERLLGLSQDRFLWRALDASGPRTFPHLAVIRFRGTCEVGPEVPSRLSRRKTVLGSTAISEGQILPFLQVECDSVRALLDREPMEPLERRYGRALGQVVAHELYHILLKTGAHTVAGLSKATHSGREIGRAGTEFEPDVKQQILAALR